MKQGVAIFGSTGSVGTSTIDVIQRNAESYYIDAITAHKNVEALADPQAAAELTLRLQREGSSTRVITGDAALCEIAADDQIPLVMAAIVGFAGLAPTFAAAKRGKKILLANKESMVVAGEILNKTARDNGARLVPVDSEHNAIFQCLSDRDQTDRCVHGKDSEVVSLILTASGGPFRNWTTTQMERATVAEATNHPNWSMGSKISVDSATMMNKGLEIIEACSLFEIDEKYIEVVVHPQSVVHSMVRFKDGSILAQLGRADMRTPIANALAWPLRIDAGVPPMDLAQLNGLEFEAPDTDRFPCLALARLALRKGGAARTVLNAANEVAVEFFLQESIGFTDIAKINTHALETLTFDNPSTIDEIINIDKNVRQRTRQFIECGLKPAEMI